MTTQKICQLASCVNSTLDKSICAIVSVAALEQYHMIVDYIKKYTCFNINDFFGYIALLAVLCWISQWINEILNFICKIIPKFLKNLMCCNFSLCLLDCDKSHKSHKSSSSNKSSSCNKSSNTKKSSCSTKY